MGQWVLRKSGVEVTQFFGNFWNRMLQCSTSRGVSIVSGNVCREEFYALQNECNRVAIGLVGFEITEG